MLESRLPRTGALPSCDSGTSTPTGWSSNRHQATTCRLFWASSNERANRSPLLATSFTPLVFRSTSIPCFSTSRCGAAEGPCSRTRGHLDLPAEHMDLLDPRRRYLQAKLRSQVDGLHGRGADGKALGRRAIGPNRDLAGRQRSAAGRLGHQRRPALAGLPGAAIEDDLDQARAKFDAFTGLQAIAIRERLVGIRPDTVVGANEPGNGSGRGTGAGGIGSGASMAWGVSRGGGRKASPAVTAGSSPRATSFCLMGGIPSSIGRPNGHDRQCTRERQRDSQPYRRTRGRKPDVRGPRAGRFQ